MVAVAVAFVIDVDVVVIDNITIDFSKSFQFYIKPTAAFCRIRNLSFSQCNRDLRISLQTA